MNLRSKPTLPNATILVADTDTESLFSIAAILISQQYRVLTAPDVPSAIELANTATLDLLITDTRLACQSGEQLVTELRLDPDRHELPVMYVSATQTPGVIRRIHSSGDAFHLKKPIAPQVLIELVVRALWLPHLISSHVEQKTIQRPHVAFANNPFANDPVANDPVASPFAINSGLFGAPIGTPIT